MDGGPVPLGYEPDGRSLKVVEEDAETVRRIYELYLQLGSIYAVRQAAYDLGSGPRAVRAQGRRSISEFEKVIQMGSPTAGTRVQA